MVTIEGEKGGLTSSSASGVCVPTTSTWSRLVAVWRLFREELRDGRAVIDDAELLREAGAVWTTPAAIGGSDWAPAAVRVKDVLEDIRGR